MYQRRVHRPGEVFSTPERGTVRVGDVVLTLAALRKSPARFMRALLEAKTVVGFAECLCVSPPQRLVIRQRSGVYHLACWPNQGSQHHPACEFHRVATELSGRGGYRKDAIVEDESGVQVRLSAALSSRNTSTAATSRPIREGGAPGARSSVGLLGLTHYLWETAQLNRHTGARITWRDCHQALTRAVADIQINRRPLSESLYVVAPFNPLDAESLRQAEAVFIQRLGRRGATTLRGLLLAEIKKTHASNQGQWLKLRQTRLGLFVPEPLWRKFRTSHRAALGESRPAGSRQVAVLLVERTSRDYLRVVDGSVMLTSDQYIPCDSSHEVAMCEHLIASGRLFVKPVRYDHAESVFPDFVLTDGPRQVYVEVWGVLGRRQYETRKAEKQAFYREQGIPTVEWNVKDPLPLVGRDRTP